MSEPTTWRMAKTLYRIRGSKCSNCKKIYFPPKSFCNKEGRYSKLEDIYFEDKVGRIYSCSTTRLPTTKFEYLTSFLSVYVSFSTNSNSVLIPGRLTDFIPTTEETRVDGYIDNEVIPRFRKVYSDGLIHYSRLQFSFLNDYYQSHLTREITPIENETKVGAVGIVGYGTYLPKYRIKVDDVAKALGKDPLQYRGGVREKTLPFYDEDTRTFTIEATERALFHSNIDREKVDVVAVGTESNPYAVYPIAATVVDASGINNYANAYDTQFACKAATSQIGLMCGAIKSSIYRNTIVVGADNSQAKPGDSLDYSVGAGAAALMLGRDGVIAILDCVAHYTSDTPDFYRREGKTYPEHGHRFTGEQAYFKHVINAGEALLKKYELKPSDFDFFVAHQPNSKFPRKAGEMLGFNRKQYEIGNVVDYIGNLYAGSAIAGLCAILDIAKPSQRIMMVAYGSGAGSDAYCWSVTEEIDKKRDRCISMNGQIFHPNREYVNYEFYRKSKSPP